MPLPDIPELASPDFYESILSVTARHPSLVNSLPTYCERWMKVVTGLAGAIQADENMSGDVEGVDCCLKLQTSHRRMALSQ